MTTRSHEIDGTPGSLAGDLSVPLGPPSGRSATILFFPRPVAAASMAGGEEEADCWESVGLLAVRMVGQWSLPFLHVEVAPGPGGGETREP